MLAGPDPHLAQLILFGGRPRETVKRQRKKKNEQQLDDLPVHDDLILNGYRKCQSKITTISYLYLSFFHFSFFIFHFSSFIFHLSSLSVTL